MAEAKPAEGAAPAPKKNLGKLLVPLFAAVNLAVMGGGAFMVYKGTIAHQPPTLTEEMAKADLEAEKKNEQVDEDIHFTMPPFTVNLAGTPRRLIRVEMTFEMLDKDGFEEIVRNSPLVRDEIVRILNRKSFDDVESIQGKLFLKDQIAVTLNTALSAAVIKDIYFSEFLVQ